MVSKKNGKIIKVMVGMLLLAGLFFLFYFGGIFEKIAGEREPLSIGDVPTGCNIAGSGTTDYEFTCPGICDVNGWNECTNRVVVDGNVVARTDLDFSKGIKYYWLDIQNYLQKGHAIRVSPKALRISGDDSTLSRGYFIREGTSVGSNSVILCNINQLVTFDQTFETGQKISFCIVEYGRDYALSYISPGQKGSSFIILSPSSKVGDIIPDSINSESEYAERNQEVYSSTGGYYSSSYQCSEDWKIYSSGGSLKDSGSSTYSSTSSGKYQTGVKRLTSGEKFNFPGKITYAVIDSTQACVIDICNADKSSVIKCIQNTNRCLVKSSQLETCNIGEFCVDSPSGASCQEPFDSSLVIDDGFTVNDPIVFTYKIDSDRINSAYVTFKLVDTRDTNKILAIAGPTNLNFPSTKTITFPAQDLIGTYRILVEKDYGGNTLTPETYDFRIGNPLQVVLKIPYSPLTGTQLFTGGDIYVDVEVNENGVPTTEIANVIMNAKLKKSNGVTVTLNTPNPQIKNDAYRYIYKVDEPGLFSVEAKADKFGVISNTEKREVEVRSPRIDIGFTNIGSLVKSQPGTLIVKFETKNYAGDYLDTQNTMKLIPAGASVGRQDIDVSSYITRTDTGKYEMSYNFEEGTYIIEVKSTASQYNIISELRSPSLDVKKENVVPECTSSEQCGAGEICLNNQCSVKDPPVGLYFAVGIVSLFVIILLLIIINLIRKSKKSKIDAGFGY